MQASIVIGANYGDEGKEPHMLLFDGGPFPTEAKIDETIQSLMEVQI